MAVTMKQLAEEAGVSVPAVSLILRNRGNAYSSETRRAVMAAAKKLRYRPNLLAQGIRNGKTQTVGVVSLVTDPFWSGIFTGIRQRLVDADYLPLVAWSDGPTEDREGTAELQNIHRLIERRVDGIIITPINDLANDDYFHEANDHGVPLVVIDRMLPNAHTDYVGTDDERGGYEVGKHLLSLGHRRLLHLAGSMITSPGRLRAEGFRRAMAECSEARYQVVDVGWGVQPIQGLEQLLTSDLRPTAVFAANDYIATFVYKAAAATGLMIPRDLSIVGFGKFLNEWMSPQLVSYDQFPEEVGRRAAELMLMRLGVVKKTSDEPLTVRIAGQLVPGGSVAEPNAMRV